MFLSINMKIQYMMLVTCAALCFTHNYNDFLLRWKQKLVINKSY